MTLQQTIEQQFGAGSAAIGDPDALAAFLELRDALEAGAIRSAEPDSASPTGWRVNAWVKQGILLGFRIGQMEGSDPVAGAHRDPWDAAWNPPDSASDPAHNSAQDRPALSDYFYGEQKGWAARKHGPGAAAGFPFIDKNTYPPRRFTPDQGIRIVPGGSSVRAGAYLARSVVAMPPMYVNVGAWVGPNTMIDSHALVGSCAQIGARVHLSAAAQIGGVLEPVNAAPVIIEDDVFVGGNTGVYEGTVVRERAVLAAGVVLTRGVPVFDAVRKTTYRSNGDAPLEIPAGAVVVPGTRPMAGEWAKALGLSVQAPVIVKYRDAGTDASTALEQLLR